MKIKTAYTGSTLTARYFTIHFKLEVGETIVRSSEIKIAVDEIPEDLFSEVLDKIARRKLIEIWASEDMLPGID